MKHLFISATVLIGILIHGVTSRAADGLPPIKSVEVQSSGRLAVNGAPFFPILLYDAPTDDASLARFHEWGFNVIAAGDAKLASTLPAKGFYAAVHGGSEPIADLSGVLLMIGADSPALSFPTDTLAKTKAENAKTRALAPGRPLMNAIGYWADEPAGVKAGTLLAKEKYEDLLDAMDVPAPYLYPIPYQPISSVGDAVARIKKASPSKCVLPILQLFVWEPADRYPTPAELRAMAYASLIEGAGGIGYYSYGSVTGKTGTNIAKEQPALWESVKPLNAEITAIAHHLATAKPDEKTKIDKADVVRAKAVEGLILLVNQSDQAQAVTIHLAHPTKAVTPSNWGRALAGDDLAPKVQLAPFEAIALRYATE